MSINSNRDLLKTVRCNNSVFGDPAVGVDKVCAFSSIVLITPAPKPLSIWITCAAEDGNCSFDGTTEIRYGANNNYSTKTATTTITCNNATFGDPVVGLDKICQYAVASGVPVPTPSPAPVGDSLLTDHVFAANSFWYTPIPTNVNLNPRSASMAQDIQRQIATSYGTVA